MEGYQIPSDGKLKEKAAVYYICTIGYEGRSLDGFLRTARDMNIAKVIDVRISAKSRKKGFSRSALKDALASVCVDYIHMPELGVPQDKREYLLGARGSEKFCETYLEIIGENSAKIGDISSMMWKGRVLLLCYERNPSDCHRSALSDLIVRIFPGPVRVLHIL